MPRAKRLSGGLLAERLIMAEAHGHALDVAKRLAKSNSRCEATTKRGPRHPNIAGIHVAGRSALDRDAGGQTPEMDRVPRIGPEIGKAAPGAGEPTREATIRAIAVALTKAGYDAPLEYVAIALSTVAFPAGTPAPEPRSRVTGRGMGPKW